MGDANNLFSLELVETTPLREYTYRLRVQGTLDYDTATSVQFTLRVSVNGVVIIVVTVILALVA